MRTVGFLFAYAALIGVAFSWIAAFIFYLRTHGTLSAEQSYLRGQLFFNWLFVNGKLVGEARENARKVNIAIAVFLVCLVVGGAALSRVQYADRNSHARAFAHDGKGQSRQVAESRRR